MLTPIVGLANITESHLSSDFSWSGTVVPVYARVSVRVAVLICNALVCRTTIAIGIAASGTYRLAAAEGLTIDIEFAMAVGMVRIGLRTACASIVVAIGTSPSGTVLKSGMLNVRIPEQG